MTRERGTTPLAEALIARIRTHGPLSVEDYVDACLGDSEHGYYRRRRAIGRDGDFITAPEISQIFGELIGLWCAVVWQQMGAPSALRLIELGPGRGTLMLDVLRAARAMTGFRESLRVQLVEISETLIAEQRATLADAGAPVAWHRSLDAIDGEGPAIVIANEFLDALPLAQWVWRNGAWRRRCVGLDAAGGLGFVEGDASAEIELANASEDGAVFESRAKAFADLANRLSSIGASAALFIDYGHEAPGLGDTLQGVRAHRYEDPLAAPGECDLTAQVDFSSFAAAMTKSGFACDGPVTQAEFLGRLGIAERASRLMAANPGKAGAIETAVGRLMAPGGMGARFNAIGARAPTLPPLPGLEPVDSSGRQA